jgi:hypothetical protein
MVYFSSIKNILHRMENFNGRGLFRKWNILIPVSA